MKAVLGGILVMFYLCGCSTKSLKCSQLQPKEQKRDTLYYEGEHDHIMKINRYSVDTGSNLIKEGLSEIFYRNGQLLEATEYRNNRPWNHICTYDSLGNILERQTLKDGNGYLKRSIPGTTEHFRMEFKNGISNGLIEQYHQNHELSLSFFSANGKNDGRMIGFYADGDTSLTTNFIKSVNVGPMKYYARNGNIAQILHFKSPPFSFSDSLSLYSSFEESFQDLSWSMDPLGLYNGIQEGPEIKFDTIGAFPIDTAWYIGGNRIEK